MKCAICQKDSTDKYCSNCKQIRIVYVIHKLLEKISIKERFNNTTLITKKITNIELYDLELLYSNNLVTKDRYNNYQMKEETIKEYLEKNDKSNKTINLTEKQKNTKNNKTKEIPKTEDVILILEKSFNFNETFTIEQISELLEISNKDAKIILNNLNEKNLIKKSRRGQKYTLNMHQIIKYKKMNKINEKKITTIKEIKKPQNTLKETKNKETTSNVEVVNNNKKKEKTVKQIHSEKEIIPIIRTFINEELMILPRGVNENDFSIKQLFEEFNLFSTYDKVSLNKFEELFHKVINTYPHIRHKTYNSNIRYNVKLRKTPNDSLLNIQYNNHKFSHNEKRIVELEDNSLKIRTKILPSELSILFNLIVFTNENILEFTYKKENDLIDVLLKYDLTDEDSELWLNFLKSYNLCNT